MAKVNLGEMKARVLDRADMTNSGFIDSDRLVNYINDALSEFHDILVTSYEDYLSKIQSITLVSGTESYDLPDDFYKTRKVFLVPSAGVRHVLRRFNLDELDSSETDYIQTTGDNRFLRYRLMGNKMYFTPEPNSADTVEHWYIKQVTKLVEDEDELDYTFINGWEELPIVSAAIKCLAKEETDPSVLMAEKAELKQRIIAAAPARDAGEPHRIRDIRKTSVPWYALIR